MRCGKQEAVEAQRGAGVIALLEPIESNAGASLLVKGIN